MIDIPDCKYEVSKYPYSYCDNNIIGLYLTSNHNLSDTELSTYVCDTITHEYIHHILEVMFHPLVTYLFDSIGDSLNSDISLLRRVTIINHIKRNISTTELCLWSDVIKAKGIKGLIESYGLNINSVSQLLRKGC